MYREILEKNGYEIAVTEVYDDKAKKHILGWIVVSKLFECCIKKDDITKTKEQATEQACRQYVKENGFKLEWFHQSVKEVFLDICESNLEVMNSYTSSNSTNKDIKKLIADLFANDMEIIYE